MEVIVSDKTERVIFALSKQKEAPRTIPSSHL